MKLALVLPGFQRIEGPVGLKTEFVDLGSLISPLLNIAFYAAILLAFYFLIWGAFQYIMAQGKKEELAKARARITWALVGLFVVLMAYFIAGFVSQIFPPTSGGVPL